MTKQDSGFRRQDSGDRIQDSGFGIQEVGAERGGLHLESRILDPALMARMRWRCRRGLLELDIVLGRFVGQHYAALDEKQKIDFDVLLDLSDNALWDRITGKEPAENEAQEKLLDLINATQEAEVNQNG